MNTVTLSPNTYKSVERYARLHNVSVERFVEDTLLAVIVRAPKEAVQRDYYNLSELRGIIKREASDTKTDKELVGEYIMEKYGV